MPFGGILSDEVIDLCQEFILASRASMLICTQKFHAQDGPVSFFRISAELQYGLAVCQKQGVRSAASQKLNMRVALALVGFKGKGQSAIRCDLIARMERIARQAIRRSEGSQEECKTRNDSERAHRHLEENGLIASNTDNNPVRRKDRIRAFGCPNRLAARRAETYTKVCSRSIPRRL